MAEKDQLPLPKFKTSYETGSRNYNQPYFLDMENGEKLMFQTVPLQISYDPTQTWAVIESPGRNNPLYQYTGAEDVLNFQISWYANEESRQDVLRNTKWIEAASKNDGYTSKPHRIKFMFGSLFSEATWIIAACPVNWSLFNREMGMLPCLATQDITLKRVVEDNRTHANIRNLNT